MVIPTNPDQSKTERQPHTCPNKNKQEGAAAYKQRLFCLNAPMLLCQISPIRCDGLIHELRDYLLQCIHDLSAMDTPY